MEVVRDQSRPKARATAWRLERDEATFELTIRHRAGPVQLTGAMQVVDAVLETDEVGVRHVAFVVDTGRITVSPVGMPPWRAGRLLGRRGDATLRFESTGVADLGAGEARVSGRLAGGNADHPLEIRLETRDANGALDVTAHANVNHRQLGVLWIPAGPLRAQTELVLRCRLVPAAERGLSIARPRRTVALGRRYRLMGGRSQQSR